jgi:hypothetical protein
MSRSILITVSLACGVVFGAGIDRYVMLDSRTTVAPAVTQVAEVRTGGITPPVQLQPAKTTSAALDSSQMRAMLREELGTALTAALAGVSGNSTASKPTAAPPTATPKQQQEALLAASAIIESGQWGEQERNSFHQKVAGLDPEMREQAMQRLVQAIDSGALKAPNGGPPLL